MNRMKSVARLFTVVVIAAVISLTAFAQNGSFAGKYEGTFKDDTGEQKLALDLMEDSGKYSGTLTTARGSFKILKGQMADGTLTLEIEKPAGSSTSGSMAFRKSGDELIATFTEAGKNLTVNFRKANPDEISGDWDAVADAQGQPFPFTLSLKLDGDKVTGSSNSQLGQGNITTGTWKDGKLAVVLDGNITLVATMIEGKLSGDYDFAGQSSGKWVAVKKK